MVEHRRSAGVCWKVSDKKIYSARQQQKNVTRLKIT